MGCACGTFVPMPAYSAIREHCIQHFERWEDVPGLTVEDEQGRILQCAGGFQIVDSSRLLGKEVIQLHLLGITTPLYRDLFPGDFPEDTAAETR